MCCRWRVMGCESSRSVVVEDKNKVQQASHPERISLTDLQLDVIRSTWPIINNNLMDNGVFLMTDVFITEPAVKNIFPSFRGRDIADLETDTTFRTHAIKIMETVQSAVEYIESPEQDPSQALMMLGARHATFPGFDLRFCAAFGKCLHRTWENVLGEEYTDDVRDAWTHVFEYVLQRMREGYLIYMEDCERGGGDDVVDICEKGEIATS